jgi:hypothetical protein
MVRSIVRFFRLSNSERLLFLEAVMLHLWIGLLLKLIPFRDIPRLFDNPQSSVISPDSSLLKSIRNAIQRAEKVSPWKNKCLISSLAGRCMLRRRKIKSQLSLGLGKNGEGKTIAHAWLKTGDFEIVTAGVSFHELYKF